VAEPVKRTSLLLALLLAVALAHAGPAEAARPTPPGFAPGVAPGLIQRLTPPGRGTATSTNWAGYAAYGGGQPFTTVTASWVQPAVTCPGRDQYASFWVGLDGYAPGSVTVEQIGTSSDCLGKGQPSHYAWYEMFPAPPVTIPSVPIRPGDSIRGRVTANGIGFALSIANLTTGRSSSTPQVGLGAARSSAEWVAEAPTGLNCGCTLPLARFGSMQFSGTSTAAGGHIGPISDGHWQHDKIIMASGGTTKASPSGLWFGGAKFGITWYHT